MNWDGKDFWIAGALLFFGLSAFFIVKRFVKKRHQRRLLFVFIILLVLLTWVELGVGIFGTPLTGN